MRYVMILLVAIGLTACDSGAKTARSVDIYNNSGDLIGTAALTEQPDGVQAKVKVEGLKPGLHGIHIHEFPECKGPEFKSSGNHFNPEGKKHGLMDPKGAHIGDMPNIKANDKGVAKATLMIPDATLLDGKKSLLKGDGTSIIIDEKKDDGYSQPSGDSGPRIACGIISSKQNPKKGKEPTDPTKEKGI